MSNVGKRGKVSLRVRLRDALLKGTNSTIRHNEIREVIDALSKPQAREDAQPLRECIHCGRLKVMGCRCDYEAHPAPDALRIAVEALEPFARLDVLEPSGVIIGLERWHFERARSALAALQAEQKGGA